MREMRRMPPRITVETVRQMTMPIIRRRVAVLLSGAKKRVVTDSVSWFDCITQRVPIRPNAEKKTAIGFHFRPSPSVIIYIGPPWTSPLSSLPLNITARVPSKNFVAMPTMALIHIQKMAPGPPIERATATPAMLPIPTVAAMALVSASKEEIWPFAPASLTRSAWMALPYLLSGVNRE